MAAEATVKPRWNEWKVQSAFVSYIVYNGFVQDGELFRFRLETVKIPFCETFNLSARDSLGALELFHEDRDEYPITYRTYKVSRDTSGPVEFSYEILPRVVPEDYRSSPYFDFRAEQGGANGAGVTFLAEVMGASDCGIKFRWDLSEMPEGSRGVSSFGEGGFACGSPSDIVNAYYACGKLKSIEKGQFGMYWLSDPPFDLDLAASWVRELFLKMAGFFGDSGGAYRVFIRKDPFEKSGGGTALARSYMLGYSDAMKPTLGGLKNLFAHEMVHNWTQCKDEPYGYGTWYSEGTAEYYSVMLPLRFGLSTPEKTLVQIRKRSKEYFLNPTRHLSNMEAAAQAWIDRRTQKIAYGRGFFFLGNLDARLRREGKSIDDFVKQLATKALETGEAPSVEDMLEALKAHAGNSAIEAHDEMDKGAPFDPDPDSFGPLFTCFEAEAEEESGNGKRVDAKFWDWKLRESETRTL
jgi:hypothetical protein